MSCSVCNNRITKSNPIGLCTTCKSNNAFTLSTYMVKKCYKLTDDQIHYGKVLKRLRYFTYYYSHTLCYKYLLEDVETYAQAMFLNIAATDKQKQQYEKYLAKKNEIDSILDPFVDKKAFYIYQTEYKEYLINDGVNVQKTVAMILEKYKSHEKSVAEMNKKIEQFKEPYKSYALKLPIYKNFICGYTTGINVQFERIKQAVEKKQEKDNEKKP